MLHDVNSRLVLFIIAIALHLPLNAANTSSSISGSVLSKNGQKLAKVAVKVTHIPSATSKTAMTNQSGKYSLRGLRLGGPYSLEISTENFKSVIYHRLFLTLDRPLNIASILQPLANTETIEVTGKAFSEVGGYSEDFLGAALSSSIINRDIKDIVRQHPLAVVDASGTELSIAGSNPKYNSLTIDGVAINDTFGLNANGYPAQRPPISMNAINQLTIKFSPFTLRASGFTGGTVNVVTKSGTNTLSGEVFYEWSPTNGTAKDDRLVISDLGKATEYDFDNQQTTFGLALGGALVKDKLFYFASYEQWSDEVIFNYDLATLDGHKVTLAETQRVLSALENQYGLSDSIGNAPSSDSDKKLLLKLDWNFNNAHRADFTFSQQKNKTPLNYTQSNSRINFGSHQYSQDANTRFFTSHLFSDWNDHFSTEINLSHKDHQQAANTASNWAEINNNTAQGSILAGQDKNRQGNVKSNQSTIFAIHALLFKQNIDYQFGVEIEHIRNSDLYARSSDARWFFDSIEDFENKTPRNVIYTNAYSNDKNDLTARIDSTQYAFYGQAQGELFENVVVTGGLRYETLSVDSQPNHNINYAQSYGVSNTENLNGVSIWLPRLSVKWRYSPQLTLRAGIGRFSGGTPLVWFSNAYSNDGVTKVSAPAEAVNTAINDPENITFDQVPLTLQQSLQQGNGSTNTIAENFSMPSDWRLQLAADYSFDLPILGQDFHWSSEFFFIDKQDGPMWVDQSRIKLGETAEGRTIWENRYGSDYRWDIQLTNSKNSGHNSIFSNALYKHWKNGISANVSYTHQKIIEANPGNTSTAESGYFDEVIVNRNSPLLGRGFYEIEHRLLLNLSYKTQWLKGYDTHINLLWERRSGRPFSWTLGRESRNDFGDQRSNTKVYLPYLPESPNDPAFDFSELSYQDIMDYAQQAGIAQFAGEYVPKYIGTQPWLTTLDLSITQELPGIANEHKGELYFIIDNFANLLNDDWGKSYGISSRQQLLYDVSVNANGQYILAEPRGGFRSMNFNRFNVEYSTWQLKIGIKYKF